MIDVAVSPLAGIVSVTVTALSDCTAPAPTLLTVMV